MLSLKSTNRYMFGGLCLVMQDGSHRRRISLEVCWEAGDPLPESDVTLKRLSVEHKTLTVQNMSRKRRAVDPAGHGDNGAARQKASRYVDWISNGY